MKSEKKSLFRYYRDMLAHSCRMLFSSKSRIRLTFLGVTLTVALLSAVSLFMCDNYESQKRRYAMWPQNVFCIESNRMTDAQLEAVIADHSDLYVNAFYRRDSVRYDDHIQISVIGVRNPDMKTGYLPDAEPGVFIPQLMCGRTFTEAEIEGHESAAIITQSTAMYFFGEENPLGRIISLKDEHRTRSYQIVGIIKDSLQSAEAYNQFTQENTHYSSLNMAVYTTLANAAEGDLYGINYALFYTVPAYSLNEFAHSRAVKQAFYNDSNGSSFGIMPPESLDVQYSASIESFKNNYFSLFKGLLVCESIILLLFILFSMKERVREIGIRKAVGASDTDITSQFLLENIIFSLIVSSVGCAVGMTAYLIMQYQSHVGDTFLMCDVSWRALLLTFLFSFFLIVLTSLIPGLISRRIRIVDALRFE